MLPEPLKEELDAYAVELNALCRFCALGCRLSRVSGAAFSAAGKKKGRDPVIDRP
jgi:hypothetical protein